MGRGIWRPRQRLVLKEVGIWMSLPMKSVVERLGWKILQGVDPKGDNVVGCSVWQKEGGKVGCLCRVEPGLDQKVSQVSVSFPRRRKWLASRRAGGGKVRGKSTNEETDVQSHHTSDARRRVESAIEGHAGTAEFGWVTESFPFDALVLLLHKLQQNPQRSLWSARAHWDTSSL